MAIPKRATIPDYLWSALSGLLATAVVTLWNVLWNADPDIVLYRGCVVLVVVFFTVLAAQAFARVTADSLTRSQQLDSARRKGQAN